MIAEAGRHEGRLRAGSRRGLWMGARRHTTPRMSEAIPRSREGARLEPQPSRKSFWFSLVGALPEVELHEPVSPG